MNFNKLILVFATTSVLIFLISLIFLKQITLIHPLIWEIQSFFFCTFLIVIRINQIGMTHWAKQFHIFYFISMSIRFFFSLIFMVFMILYFKNQEVTFVINFIVMYLFYTWFEIYFLIHNLRADLTNSDAIN
jgi:hypothetical protein